MSDLPLTRKFSLASKWIDTIEIPFKREEKKMVEMMLKDAFIAGLNYKTKANEENKQTKRALTIPDVVGQSEQFKCAMKLSKSGKKCDTQCKECAIIYKKDSI